MECVETALRNLKCLNSVYILRPTPPSQFRVFHRPRLHFYPRTPRQRKRCINCVQVIELPLLAALLLTWGVTKLLRAVVRPLLPSVTSLAFRIHWDSLGSYLHSYAPMDRKLDSVAWLLVTGVIIVCSLLFFWRSFGLEWFLYQLAGSLFVCLLLDMGCLVDKYVFVG